MIIFGKVVLPLFHKHEAKIDTLASSAQVKCPTFRSAIDNFTLNWYNFEDESNFQAKAEKLLQQAVEKSIKK